MDIHNGYRNIFLLRSVSNLFECYSVRKFSIVFGFFLLYKWIFWNRKNNEIHISIENKFMIPRGKKRVGYHKLLWISSFCFTNIILPTTSLSFRIVFVGRNFTIYVYWSGQLNIKMIGLTDFRKIRVVLIFFPHKIFVMNKITTNFKRCTCIFAGGLSALCGIS